MFENPQDAETATIDQLKEQLEDLQRNYDSLDKSRTRFSWKYTPSEQNHDASLAEIMREYKEKIALLEGRIAQYESNDDVALSS